MTGVDVPLRSARSRMRARSHYQTVIIPALQACTNAYKSGTNVTSAYERQSLGLGGHGDDACSTRSSLPTPSSIRGTLAGHVRRLRS